MPAPGCGRHARIAPSRREKIHRLGDGACELTEWTEAGIIDTLAAAYAEIGDFASAIKWQNKAIELEFDAKDKAEFESRLELYQGKKPYRDTKP